MAAVFSLTSDEEFITAIGGGSIQVRRYTADMNDLKTMQKTYFSSDEHWGTPIRVGPSENQYRAIQVFGTIIEGAEFEKLVKDLISTEYGCGICMFVNRLGLSIIAGVKNPTIKAMRINDYFGWSKYGVEFPQDDVSKFTVWSKADMHSGEALIDIQGMGRAMEENNEELMACKKELKEKSEELEACREQLKWTKIMELLTSSTLKDEKKKVEAVENQLLALKTTLRSLGDH